MVIELRSNDARQLLANFIKSIRIDNEHIQCRFTNNYSDEEVANILNATDANNKYVITEMLEAKKRREAEILEQIEKLKASLL